MIWGYFRKPPHVHSVILGVDSILLGNVNHVLPHWHDGVQGNYLKLASHFRFVNYYMICSDIWCRIHEPWWIDLWDLLGVWGHPQILWFLCQLSQNLPRSSLPPFTNFPFDSDFLASRQHLGRGFRGNGSAATKGTKSQVFFCGVVQHFGTCLWLTKTS